MNIIEEKRGPGMADEDIFSLIDNNPALYQCKSCTSAYMDGYVYSKCSETISTCMDALFCTKVYIPDLGLKVYDNNCEDTVTIEQ